MVETKKIIYTTNSAAQTKKVGFLLARTVLDFSARKRAVILSMRGELGAGKTQFAQGFAKGLGIKGTVNSPTFVILRRYGIEHPVYKTFYHIDLYRLDSETDLANLGTTEIVANPANIVVIEWPDIAKNMFSKATVSLDFKVTGKNERQIEINSLNEK